MKGHRQSFIRLAFLLLAAWIAACNTDPQFSGTLPDRVDFNIHIKPILSDRCFACHGPDQNKQEAGLALHEAERAFAALRDQPDSYALVPGKAHKSEVYRRIASTDPEYRMPPPESNLAISPYEIALIKKWIDQGAEYKDHWAFLPPQKPGLPRVKQTDWPRNPIDLFVLTRLEREGLHPAAEAPREILLRRLHFDLTGLPPTPEEIADFVRDEAPDAYEKAVDRLLASPHYGEHMAQDWLDLARYADTHGYTVDRSRPMWPWRDWVIRAFNENMPYDTFVLWQLAGDLLPHPTREQRIATAFNRNHAQNMEGGIVNEEFRVEYVADRASTFGTAFLGLTLQCARCHDHKYDPVSQKEFYQLYSFFNNVDEAGQISWDDAMPVPTLLLSDSAVERQLAFIDSLIGNEKQTIPAIREAETAAFAAWKKNGAAAALRERWPQGLVAHFPLEQQTGKLIWRNQAPGKSELATVQEAEVVEGKSGKGLKLNGDDIFLFKKVGIFGRAEPFSVGIWVHIPETVQKGMIVHKGKGSILYNWRGFHLALRDNKFEILMAHTWPYNAIIELSEQEVPKNEWIHLLLTYDGSSSAAGLRLYLNGRELQTQVEKDHLYKDILFKNPNDEEGLKVGARWRGTGLKDGLVDEITVFDRELTALEVMQAAGKSADALAQLKDPASQEEVFRLYLNRHSQKYRDRLRSLTGLRRQRSQLVEAIPELMVMEEMSTPRQAYVLERGAYDAYGEPVNPATPTHILAFSDNLPPNRLGLAQWLFLSENPLTARVTVNRYWQRLFGRGLVRTADDFGNQGEMPSHPLLLDWLAVDLIESDWDLKALLKTLVMSATYRQTSTATAALREKDPANVLLARGPARRLSAEQLRDHALAASGLLVSKRGGPSVKPYQPEGLYSFNPGGGAYVVETGENRYRRSLYTFWKRTIPHPAMSTFDAPDRSYCVVQRQQTHSPLQALVMLNDPQFLEAACVLAGDLLEKTADINTRIDQAFLRLAGRQALPEERVLLAEMFAAEQAKFAQQPEKMQGWLRSGNPGIPEIHDHPELAALTVVVSAIMNSDAAMMLR